MRPCAFKWQSALHSALKEQFVSHALHSTSCLLTNRLHRLIFGDLSHRERLFVTVITSYKRFSLLRWVIGCLSQTRTDQNAELCFALVLDLHMANLMTLLMFHVCSSNANRSFCTLTRSSNITVEACTPLSTGPLQRRK